MDTFLELLIPVSRTPAVFFKKIGVYLGIAVISCIFFLLAYFLPGFSTSPTGKFLAPYVFPLIVALFFGGYVYARRFNIEYEYILTNFDLDIDKIIARKRRKRVVALNIRRFEVVGPVTDENVARYGLTKYTKSKLLNLSSAVRSTVKWFAVFPDGEGKSLLIFEPDSRFQAAFQQLIPTKVAKAGYNPAKDK